MKKFACLMGLLLLVSFNAKAQDNTKIDLFGGYSYLRFYPGNSATAVDFNRGGVASGAYHLTDMFSVVGEIGFEHRPNVEDSGVNVNFVSFLFGPKVSMTRGKLHPFAQVLLGGIHADCGNCSETSSQKAFAMALGGGLDYDLYKNVALRVGQLDYVITRIPTSFTGGTASQNSFRYSIGVVFKF